MFDMWSAEQERYAGRPENGMQYAVGPVTVFMEALELLFSTYLVEAIS